MFWLCVRIWNLQLVKLCSEHLNILKLCTIFIYVKIFLSYGLFTQHLSKNFRIVPLVDTFFSHKLYKSCWVWQALTAAFRQSNRLQNNLVKKELRLTCLTYLKNGRVVPNHAKLKFAKSNCLAATTTLARYRKEINNSPNHLNQNLMNCDKIVQT